VRRRAGTARAALTASSLVLGEASKMSRPPARAHVCALDNNSLVTLTLLARLAHSLEVARLSLVRAARP
jgi:hypothetical protein